MNFFISVVLLCFQFTLPVFSQSCSKLRDIPVGINNDGVRYLKGCISNSSFLHNEVVKVIIVECSSEAIEELSEHFLSYMKDLQELLIKCSVKTIKPGAFSNLPMLKNVDLSGNKLNTISDGVFSLIPSLQYLNLSDNELASIEDYSFFNMPRLADLDLSYNKLSVLSKAWFVNTTSIEEFYVNNNLLKEIPENMFRGWQTTYAFNFDYNQISRIHDGAFEDSLDVNYLSLHHNLLTSVNLKAFAQTDASILQLDISSNLLNYLPHAFFTSVAIKRIWIFGNPFECSCLRNIENALETRKVVIKRVQTKQFADKKCHDGFDVPVCATTAEPSGLCSESESSEVTSRMRDHMKTLGFADLRDWYEQCYIVPRKTYLEV